MHTYVHWQNLAKREIIVSRAACRAVGVIGFIVLTTLGAYVRIPLPFTPVPITLQTFFVLLAGAVLGRNWGAASQGGYVFLGILGFPIFAGASFGFAVLLGTTGGYLLGFIFAAGVIGSRLSRQLDAGFGHILITMFLGSILIDLLGSVWLGAVLRVDITRMLALGFWPFLPGDFIKSIAAAAIYRRIQKRTRQIFFSE